MVIQPSPGIPWHHGHYGSCPTYQSVDSKKGQFWSPSHVVIQCYIHTPTSRSPGPIRYAILIMCGILFWAFYHCWHAQQYTIDYNCCVPSIVAANSCNTCRASQHSFGSFQQSWTGVRDLCRKRNWCIIIYSSTFTCTFMAWGSMEGAKNIWGV